MNELANLLKEILADACDAEGEDNLSRDHYRRLYEAWAVSLPRIEKEAARYRWLRDHAAYSDNISFNYNDGVRSFIFQGPATDGYIDDAITHHSRNTA